MRRALWDPSELDGDGGENVCSRRRVEQIFFLDRGELAELAIYETSGILFWRRLRFLMVHPAGYVRTRDSHENACKINK